MAQFQYTAVNSAGKKLNGAIGAINETEARKQLNTLGISILSIQQTATTPNQTQTSQPGTSTDLSKLEFEAYDKTGQKVVGTIPASSRYKAYQRLVDEYQFNVSYIVPFGATEEEKTKARQEGLTVLKAEYQAQREAEGNPMELEQEANSGDNAEFEKKKQALLQRVDFILDKIKKLLETYDEDIRPENKKIVQSYIDKLLRIKSSTNLDYIEHTSEELLKKVQDQELFLNKENLDNKRQSVNLQTKQLMATLHTRTDHQRDVVDDLETIHKKLNKSESKLLKGLSQFIAKFLPTEEEKALKQKIHVTNKQIWTFRKLWLTAPKETKAEAKASIQQIIDERNRLKKELKAMRQKRKTSSNTEEETVEEPLITEEIANFLGWLLAFYAVTYFVSHYLLAKTFQFKYFGDFNLLQSEMLRQLLISIFLWYILFSLRVEYFRYKNWANLIIIPIGIVINAALIFNL